MSFDLDQELLEVENDSAVYGTTKIGVLVRDLLGFVTNIIKDVLGDVRKGERAKGGVSRLPEDRLLRGIGFPSGRELELWQRA
jgi:hypothetical protein